MGGDLVRKGIGWLNSLQSRDAGEGPPQVSKRAKRFKRVQRAFRRRAQQVLVLVPELVKFRDGGQISPAECAVWSQLIGLSRSSRMFHGEDAEQVLYLIRRAASGWRLFKVKTAQAGKMAVSETGNRMWHDADRGLLIFLTPRTGDMQFAVLTPSPSIFAAAKATGTTTCDKQVRHVLKCRVCAWSVEDARRIEKSKKKHVKRCTGAEFDVAPYVPIRLQGSSSIPTTALTRGRSLKRRRGAGGTLARLPKGASVDRPLHRRGDFSAPDVYPDDN